VAGVAGVAGAAGVGAGACAASADAIIRASARRAIVQKKEVILTISLSNAPAFYGEILRAEEESAML